jgi:hypothetical protein
MPWRETIAPEPPLAAADGLCSPPMRPNRSGRLAGSAAPGRLIGAQQ